MPSTRFRSAAFRISPVAKLKPPVQGQLFDPPAVQLHIAVQDRDPSRLGFFPAPIDGAGESGVLTHLDHPASRRTGSFRRTVAGSIVDDQDLGGRNCLRAQTGKKPIEQIRAIVYGYDRGNGIASAHKSKL